MESFALGSLWKLCYIEAFEVGMADVLEERMARVEGILEEVRTRLTQLESRVEARFNHIDARFAQVESRFNQIESRFNQIESRFNQVDTKFNWVLGLQITMWVSIILAILTRG